MNPEQENFEDLVRLIALKRHEQPPPGYFNTLPSKIQNRIERELQTPRSSIFSRLFSDRIKPALAYSFVLTVCALMAFGVNSFLHLDAQPVAAGDSPLGTQNRVAVLGANSSQYQAAVPWAAGVGTDNGVGTNVPVVEEPSTATSLLPQVGFQSPSLDFPRAQPAGLLAK